MEVHTQAGPTQVSLHNHAVEALESETTERDVVEHIHFLRAALNHDRQNEEVSRWVHDTLERAYDLAFKHKFEQAARELEAACKRINHPLLRIAANSIAYERDRQQSARLAQVPAGLSKTWTTFTSL